MRQTHPVCVEPVELTTSELDQLTTLADPAHTLELVIYCELEAGHPDPHAALAQSALAPAGGGSQEQHWWVRWSPTQRDPVRILPVCTVRSTDQRVDDEHGGCGLPDGHSGRHSFDLDDPPGRTPSPKMQAVLNRLAANLHRHR